MRTKSLLKNLSLFTVAAIASPVVSLLTVALIPVAWLAMEAHFRMAQATRWCCNRILRHIME